jgi:hypothetical protein
MSTILDRFSSLGRRPANRAARAVQAQADIVAYEQEEHTKWGTFLSDLEAEQMTMLSAEQARRRPLVPSAIAEEGEET